MNTREACATWRCRRGIMAAFATLVVLLFPGAARAATAWVVEVNPEDPSLVLRYEAAAGEVNVVTVRVGAGGVTLVDTGARISAGQGCVAVNEHEVLCVADQVRANLGDKADTATAETTTTPGFYASFWGWSGDDDLSLSSQFDGFLAGGKGTDHLLAGNEGSFLIGGAGNDLIEGGAGPDWIIGDEGDDTLRGGDGADKFIPALGSDTLAGGLGTDTVIYRPATRSMVVNLVTGVAIGNGPDALADIENVIGSDFADKIRGNGQANRLTGAGGNDILRGRPGEDVLLGGRGWDVIWARDGQQDHVQGGYGVRDRARVDRGLDVVQLIEIFF